MYSGITVLLNRPSRFDHSRLISGNAGEWFDKQIGKHGLSREHLHIVSVPEWNARNRQLPDDTKLILALGSESHSILNNNETTLSEHRGSPYYYSQSNILVISSFTPQDSFDFRNYEESYHSTVDGGYDMEEDRNDKTFNKGHGVTSRKNYRFWLSKDIHKAIRIARDGMEVYAPTYVMYPSIEEIVSVIYKHSKQNHYFHIDIETDPDTLDITCFAFTLECHETTNLLTPVYVVPLRRYNYVCAYETPYKIWQILSYALANNIVVTHNGHQFDLFIFTYKYRIPFSKRNWDTMIGHHRCFPEIEKSLGHSISLFTDLPYHKNDGIYKPFNTNQEMELWKYCGKDVFGMYRCRVAQEMYAKSVGAYNSIIEANESIVVYLTETFTGIRRDANSAKELVIENEKRIEALERVLVCLVGRDINVQSPPQMSKYFFNKKSEGGLQLEPFAYGKISKKTGKASPKADEKSLLKLQIKYNIASIAVILELRKLKKQNSSLDIAYWNPYGLCADIQLDKETINEEELEEINES